VDENCHRCSPVRIHRFAAGIVGGIPPVAVVVKEQEHVVGERLPEALQSAIGP
jgi:hypothetical protein